MLKQHQIGSHPGYQPMGQSPFMAMGNQQIHGNVNMINL